MMARLRDKLDDKDIRPFFLVPSSVSSGFHDLAHGLHGQVHHVPLDSTDVGPYHRALMDIADQLSREYTLRFTVKGGSMAPETPRIRVRHLHVWTPVGALPKGTLVGLHEVPRGRGEHGLLAVTRTAGVLAASDPSSATWEPVPLPAMRGAVAATLRGRSQLFLVSTEGEIVEIPVGRKGRKARSYEVGAVLQAAYTRAEELWILATGAEGKLTLRRLGKRDRKPVAAGEFEAPEPDTHPLLFRSFGDRVEKVCVLASTSEVACTEDAGARWSRRPVSGLPREVLSDIARVVEIPGRPGALLFPAADGALFRSIDDGARWRRVLEACGAPRDVTFVRGARAAVCAVSPHGTECSEDTGRTWFSVARPFGDGHGGQIATAGHEIVVARNGQILRLDRVANREMPSSAVYFGTDEDEPNESLHQFIRGLMGRFGWRWRFRLMGRWG